MDEMYSQGPQILIHGLLFIIDFIHADVTCQLRCDKCAIIYVLPLPNPFLIMTLQ